MMAVKVVSECSRGVVSRENRSGAAGVRERGLW